MEQDVRPMLVSSKNWPADNQDSWWFEPKYDGYRALLKITKTTIRLTSRTGKPLDDKFPEVIEAASSLQKGLKDHLPVCFDGEVVALVSNYRSVFQVVKSRSASSKVTVQHDKRISYVVFDMLEMKGKSLRSVPIEDRKKQLGTFIESPVDVTRPSSIQRIELHTDAEKLLSHIWEERGEGIIAKRRNSVYRAGTRSEQWQKKKLRRKVSCFFLSLQTSNDNIEVGVFGDGNKVVSLGAFRTGMQPHEKQAVLQLLKQNGTYENGIYYLHPALCIEVGYTEWSKEKREFREPHFLGFLPDKRAEECTWEQFLLDGALLPEEVSLTHISKPLWDDFLKLDYIRYIREVFPYILPFCHNRVLTVIRYPHGMYDEGFYQKNRPESAPSFVRQLEGGIRCDSVETAIWLANQLAMEWHLPFQTLRSQKTDMILWDLDPADEADYRSAVIAAHLLHDALSSFHITSFVKTSGRKGIQVYVPLQKPITYQEASVITSFFAKWLVENDPDRYTIERFKEKRAGKLYVDYIQHGKEKTVIAPYSLRRGDPDLPPTVATPLYWNELEEQDRPPKFSPDDVLRKIEKTGCPFATFFSVENDQPVRTLIHEIRSRTS